MFEKYFMTGKTPNLSKTLSMLKVILQDDTYQKSL